MTNRLPPEHRTQPDEPPDFSASFEQSFRSYLEHAYFGQVHTLPEKMVGQVRASFMAGCVVCLGRTLCAITENPTPHGAEKAIKDIRDEIEAYAEKVRKGGL